MKALIAQKFSISFLKTISINIEVIIIPIKLPIAIEYIGSRTFENVQNQGIIAVNNLKVNLVKNNIK